MKRWRVLLLILTAIVFGGISADGQNKLTGVVNYHDIDELPMPNVNVGLYDMQDVLIESVMTSENGFFTFDNINDGEYLLKSTSYYEPNGIDLEDAQLVLLHLLGYIELTEIQLNAADVNNSGQVTWYDYVYIVVNYLLYGQPFPAGEWQFEEYYVNLSSRESGDTTSLWGTATGEVELDWEPSGRTLNEVSTTLQPYQFQNNEELEVYIQTDYTYPVSGFSMDLAFPNEVIDIIDVQGPDENLNYNIDEENGILRLTWLNEFNGLSSTINGEQLVKLKIQAKNNDIIESAFTLLPGNLMLDANGDKVELFEVRLPALLKNEEIDFELQVNTYPNPAVDKINVRMTLPDANYGSVYIYDLSGRLVNKMENLSFSEGANLLSVNTQNFIAGHYFYFIELGGSQGYKVKGRFFKSE